MREIKGEKVLLKPLTRELCHEIYIKYVSDPMMTNKIYKYSKESVDDYYNRRINDNSRRMFAITVD